jgi:hypothetical protein
VHAEPCGPRRTRIAPDGARGRRRGLSALLAVALLAGAACGCDTGGTPGPARRDRAAVQRVLDRQAAAVRAVHAKRGDRKRGDRRREQGDGARSEGTYLAAIDTRAGHYRASQRRVFRNLRRLPLTQWSYRVMSVRRTHKHAGGQGAPRVAEASVELGYRLRGDDRVPVTSTEKLGLSRRGGRWYIAGELPGSAPQLWDQGEVAVLHGKHSIVLGVGQSGRELRSFARDADKAVTEVERVWKRPWPRRVVLEVPASLRRMARLLDSSPTTYQGIAAVTTGEAGESTHAPADRVIVNPESYGQLSAMGRQVVLTHETVHVATRTHTGPATPLWLSEGIADWTGYRGSGQSPEQIAPELTRAVRHGDAPRELPSDADFRFGNDQDALGRAYESGWLACRFIARTWGIPKLFAFYLRVGKSDASGKSDGSEKGTARGGEAKAGLDRALREQLGVDRAEFTQRWRAYVRGELT